MADHSFPLLATYSEEENILELFYHLAPEIYRIHSVLAHPSPTSVVNFLRPKTWRKGLFCGRDSFSFKDNPLQEGSVQVSTMFLLICGEKHTKENMIELCRIEEGEVPSTQFEALGRLFTVSHIGPTRIFAGNFFYVF